MKDEYGGFKATEDVTEYEEKKREEEDVVKKLVEMEEELKVSAGYLKKDYHFD